MEKKKKVLISGASISGLTLAYWLIKYGFEVTVVEKNQGLRLGGQNIDVKGPAWEIVQRMGLDKKVVAATTTEVGIRFVNTRNKTVAEFPKDNALSMTQEIEILRGDLVELLYQPVKEKAEFLFGNQITKVSETSSMIEVSFQHGENAEYNLLLIAEGIGSHTRQLVFGKSINFRYLGLYCAYLTIKKDRTDTRWARWCNTERGIVFLIRPDNHGKTRACIFFRSPERGYEKLSIEKQKKLLTDKIKGVGWESARIKNEIERSDDLYFERVSQVKAKYWYKDRVAMTGDAAYCATPISGKGTDAAIAGAYILAGELVTGKSHGQAFHNYEVLMRPYIHKIQKRPPGVPNLVYPTSKFGVAMINTLFRIVASPPAKLIARIFGGSKSKPKHEIELKDYSKAIKV
ncbi:FAD-dependent monooxygenase [Pedobacter agri]|uniref:FAD-dependent monooxygenase n=1 Tax=Pedobacter agri TaxID=454586 RepID=A0A9X3I916_9SPHI|nr:FAD-dependent monooxygenase [Pedobacter agri]MCX3264835.1 FAD-dependent monooxygenase [Pedobacter agri]